MESICDINKRKLRNAQKLEANHELVKRKHDSMQTENNRLNRIDKRTAAKLPF